MWNYKMMNIKLMSRSHYVRSGTYVCRYRKDTLAQTVKSHAICTIKYHDSCCDKIQ